MLHKEMFVGYGGAKGGGKSHALRTVIVMLCAKYENLSAVLIRRTYDEVKSNQIQYIEQMLKDAMTGDNGIKHNAQDHIFYFPNGSRLKYTYCSSTKDLQQFQGMSYDIIGLDEATQFEYEVFTALAACLRGSPELPKRMYITCNPGGIGHEWVKRLFIDRDFREGENPDDFAFVQALASDNVFNGEHYMQTLNLYDEPLRSAYRDGKWDIFIGQAFPQWDEEAISVDPFQIPDHWTLSMSIDYGFDCFAPIWYATDEQGVDYILRGAEYKDCVVREAAEHIFRIEHDLGITERRIRRYAPPDLFRRSTQTGKTSVDMFAENGYTFMPSDNNREAGWLAIRQRLSDGQLKIIRGAAPELNKAMKIIQYVSGNPNDCEKTPHDITHSPDSLRYYCVMRNKRAVVPLSATKRDKRYVKTYDDKRPRSSRFRPGNYLKGW